MLNMDDPMFRHIMGAGRCLDRILGRAKQMTATCSPEMRRLRFQRCVADIDTLQSMSVSRFGGKDATSRALLQLQDALSQLANQSTSSRYSEDRCPACGDWLNYLPDQWGNGDDEYCEMYCRRCLTTVMPSLLVLKTREHGFATEEI